LVVDRVFAFAIKVLDRWEALNAILDAQVFVLITIHAGNVDGFGGSVSFSELLVDGGKLFAVWKMLLSASCNNVKDVIQPTTTPRGKELHEGGDAGEDDIVKVGRGENLDTRSVAC